MTTISADQLFTDKDTSHFIEDYTHVPLSNRGREFAISEAFLWLERCPYLKLEKIVTIPNDHTIYILYNLQKESPRYEQTLELKRYVYAPKLVVTDSARNMGFMTLNSGQFMTVGGILTQILDLFEFDVFLNYRFMHMDTGGGCTAYHGWLNPYDQEDQIYMYLTSYDDELTHPCSPMDPICVGFYSMKEGYLESYFCSNLWDLILTLTDESYY